MADLPGAPWPWLASGAEVLAAFEGFTGTDRRGNFDGDCGGNLDEELGGDLDGDCAGKLDGSDDPGFEWARDSVDELGGGLDGDSGGEVDDGDDTDLEHDFAACSGGECCGASGVRRLASELPATPGTSAGTRLSVIGGNVHSEY